MTTKWSNTFSESIQIATTPKESNIYSKEIYKLLLKTLKD
jgi:hypothetical protein